MSNIECLPGRRVNKKIRLVVYKKALRLSQSNKNISGLRSFGLCLVLPCILWKLKLFTNLAPCGKEWHTNQTHTMFPEIEPYVKSITLVEDDTERMKYRRKLLRQWIENLSAK